MHYSFEKWQVRIFGKYMQQFFISIFTKINVAEKKK